MKPLNDWNGEDVAVAIFFTLIPIGFILLAIDILGM